MYKMWSMLCAIVLTSPLSTFAASSIYRYGRIAAVTPVTPSNPPPASTYHPILSVLPLNQTSAPQTSLDSQILQQVFGNPNQTPLDLVGSAQSDQAVLSQAEAEYYEAIDDFRPSYLLYDDFDLSLTKRVASLSNDNFLLSPMGLKLALAILTEAATGITAAELQFVLGFHSNSTNVRAKFVNILDSLQTKSSQYILDLGSRIYVGNSAEPRQKFAAAAEQYYKTEVKKADFDHPAAAVADINSWISNITHGKIPMLVSEDDVAGIVMMVLNTLYFKGTWRHQFAPNETKFQNFFPSTSMVTKVPFMTIENKFFYAESPKMEAKILRMPYLGKKFSMYLIVPNSIAGMTRVLNELTAHQLRQEMAFLTERSVRVMMPTFKFEFASQLDGVLKDLGIRQAFENTASFPGIARGEKLEQMIRISRVLQKSGIEVNELGSVAYTATEITLVNKFGEDDEGVVEVIANKPFLFFIEDESTRQLLFSGRINNPTAPQGSFH